MKYVIRIKHDNKTYYVCNDKYVNHSEHRTRHIEEITLSNRLEFNSQADAETYAYKNYSVNDRNQIDGARYLEELNYMIEKTGHNKQKRVEVKRAIRNLGATMGKDSPIFFDLRKLRKFRKKVGLERMHKIKRNPRIQSFFENASDLPRLSKSFDLVGWKFLGI